MPSARFVVESALLCALAAPGLTKQTTQSAPGRPSSLQCEVRRVPPSPADLALARGQYPEAAALYREQMGATSTEPDRAHYALLQALMRQHQFSEAETDIAAWRAAAPGNPWSRIALNALLWRRGKVSAELETAVKNFAGAPCNPQAHVDAARMLLMEGMSESARREIDTAHTLDPADPEIGNLWLNSQPRSVRLEALTRYLTFASSLPTADRVNLTRERDLLSQPAPHRCQLQGNVRNTFLRFRTIQDGPSGKVSWGLEAVFNGKKRRLEIATGVHGLVLNRSAASELHLPVEGQEKGRTLGDSGDLAMSTVSVASIRIGDLEFHDCPVKVLAKTPPGMYTGDGLIGGDVFADFLLTLDYPAQVLRLDPLPPRPNSRADSNVVALATGPGESDGVLQDRYVAPAMEDWTRVYRAGHELLLPVRLNTGPLRLFLIDTGATANFVSYDAALGVAKISKGSDIRVTGLSGSVNKLFTTGSVDLAFAHLHQTSQSLTAMDMSHMAETAGVEIGGVLGNPVLHQLTVQIDYRDNLMNFIYDPKRVKSCLPGMQTADCY